MKVNNFPYYGFLRISCITCLKKSGKNADQAVKAKVLGALKTKKPNFIASQYRFGVIFSVRSRECAIGSSARLVFSRNSKY